MLFAFRRLVPHPGMQAWQCISEANTSVYLCCIVTVLAILFNYERGVRHMEFLIEIPYVAHHVYGISVQYRLLSFMWQPVFHMLQIRRN